MRSLLPIVGVLAACSARPAAPARQTQMVAPALVTPAVVAPRPPTEIPAVAPPPAAVPRVRVDGFDVRATFGTSPISILRRGRSREPDSRGTTDGDVTVWRFGPGNGEPVRVVQGDTVCDGTLGARIRVRADYLDTESDDRAAMADEVVGCAGHATLAIVHPTPGAPWPAVLDAHDPSGASAVAAARAAAMSLTRGASPDSFEGRAYRLEDDVYAMAWGPHCDQRGDENCAGTAVVVIEPGQPPRTLIVRPVHFPWDDTSSATYSPCGIMDVDGDGGIELCESMTSHLGAMLRLIRPGARHAGEIVWRVEERAEYTLPAAGPVPPPLGAR